MREEGRRQRRALSVPAIVRRVQGTLSADRPGYARHKCAHEEGDAPSHKDHCGGWASSGECVRNFGL